MIYAGIDYSTYVQTPITSDMAAALAAAGIERVCLALDTSDATISSAVNLHNVGIGLHGYRELSGPDYASQALAGAASFATLANQGVSIGRYFLTAERDPGQAWVTQQLQAAVAAVQEYNIGIYTGYWYWVEQMGLGSLFPNLPVWIANYDGVASLPNVGWGGWGRAWGKQYASPLTIPGFGVTVDGDVFAE